MTSPLRRKRPITVRVPSTAARTAFSLFVLLVGGLATAQTPPNTNVSPYTAWPAPAARLDTPQQMAPSVPALPTSRSAISSPACFRHKNAAGNCRRTSM